MRSGSTSLRGPGRKYGTPVSKWSLQLVSRIGVPDNAPSLALACRACIAASTPGECRPCDHSATPGRLPSRTSFEDRKCSPSAQPAAQCGGSTNSRGVVGRSASSTRAPSRFVWAIAPARGAEYHRPSAASRRASHSARGMSPARCASSSSASEASSSPHHDLATAAVRARPRSQRCAQQQSPHDKTRTVRCVQWSVSPRQRRERGHGVRCAHGVLGRGDLLVAPRHAGPEDRKQRQCLSHGSSGTHKAAAVPWPRQQCDTQGSGGSVSRLVAAEGLLRRVEAFALGQPHPPARADPAPVLLVLGHVPDVRHPRRSLRASRRRPLLPAFVRRPAVPPGRR